MPGGAQAIREPWRMAAVWAEAAGELDRATQLLDVDATRIEAVVALARSDMTRSTTSMGRLFDAVAVLLGCRTRVSYEAQAAIELEAMARTVRREAAPPLEGTVLQQVVDDGRVLDPAPLVARVIADRLAGVDPCELAAGFHEAIGRAAAEAGAGCAAAAGLDTVVLTGGVFQNCRLQGIVATELRASGLTVLCHSSTPPNDGGISIGQAAIAAFVAP
jgi:hydrogenase maturation protein HypF